MAKKKTLLIAALSFVACAGPAVTIETGPVAEVPSTPDGSSIVPPEPPAPPAPPDAASDACGACPTFSFCADGTCRCPADRATVCDGTCIETDSDLENCGSCNHGCAVPAGKEARCGEGVCRTIETTLVPPLPQGGGTEGLALARDEGAVYLLAVGALFRMAKPGLSTFEPLTAPLPWNPSQHPTLLVAGRTDLFFAGPPGVFQVAKTGGAHRRIFTEGARSLALSDTHLYIGTNAFVYRIALDALAGGSDPDAGPPPVEKFLEIGAYHLAVRGNWVYVAQAGYYADPLAVARFDLTTRMRKDLATTVAVTGLLALPDGVAWTSGTIYDGPDAYGDLSVYRWSETTATITRLSKGGFPSALTGDDTRLYWTNGRALQFDFMANTLDTLALGPGAKRAILATTPGLADTPGASSMSSPIVDGDSLVWLDRDSAKSVIRRLTPR